MNNLACFTPRLFSPTKEGTRSFPLHVFCVPLFLSGIRGRQGWGLFLDTPSSLLLNQTSPSPLLKGEGTSIEVNINVLEHHQRVRLSKPQKARLLFRSNI